MSLRDSAGRMLRSQVTRLTRPAPLDARPPAVPPGYRQVLGDRPPLRTCKACDVQWAGDGPCWCCGRPWAEN